MVCTEQCIFSNEGKLYNLQTTCSSNLHLQLILPMNAHLSKPEMALFRSPIGLISSLRSSSFYGHPFPGEGLRNVAEFSLRGRRVSFSCTSLLGCSYHPSPSVERLLGPSFYATNASWRNFRLPCRSLLLVLCSCVHTQSGGMLAAREKPVQQKGSKGHEHGSVLMQFVSKKEEPKQLTVGAKGGCSRYRMKVSQLGKLTCTYELIQIYGSLVPRPCPAFRRLHAVQPKAAWERG